MAKRFRIHDKQGNVVPYDISSASITIDAEGKSLDVKLSELVTAIAGAIKSITFNGNTPTMDAAGNVQINQVQADWSQQLPGWPSYIQNKPNLASVATTGDYNDLRNKPTIPEGVEADSDMSDFSDAPVKNRVIKAYVDAVSQRIDTLIGSGNVQGAIDTFNEVVAFLNGINSSETLAAKLLLKANSSDVYPKSQTYSKSEVDGLVADAGSVKSVTINGVTPPVDNNGNVNLGTIHDGVDGITPHIGQDGYWYIGTTNTGIKAQGERGDDGVASADEWRVVNNLDGDPADLEEGQVAVLGADQGKELKMAIDSKGVSFKVVGDTLFIRTASAPMVNVLPTSIQFDDTIFSNTRTAVVHIYGRNLTNQVEVQVSGVGFSGSTTLLPDIDGKVDEDVTITFAPTASTGTEGDGGRSYEGSVTAVCDGAESASATLEGFGVQSIQPRITATIDKAALKGVLSTTAEGEYSSEPATATLHVQATNINQAVTLAVDNAKFTLSANQISVEDALRGKDITVTYLRQSAATATDDECTITIASAYDNTDASETIDITGATAAKTTSGTIGTFGGVEYLYDGADVACKKTSSTPAELSIPNNIYDNFGYKYTPVAVMNDGFNGTGITSFTSGANITKMYTGAFMGCRSLKNVVVKDISTTRISLFKDCESLESVDCTSINFGYQYIFDSCTRLEALIIRKSSAMVTISYSNIFPSKSMTIGGEEKTVFYYTDNGVDKQKRLYVPNGLVSDYQADAIWGMFEVHSINELSE